jgi:outer membrane protein insertion porin family
LNPGRLISLNFAYPLVGFPQQAVLATDTQKIRMSTGLELQVLMPVVNAPFRFYWAYNPLRLETFVAPPIAADRSYFPNEATFINAAASVGQPLPYFERARVFRFTISRTF